MIEKIENNQVEELVDEIDNTEISELLNQIGGLSLNNNSEQDYISDNIVNLNKENISDLVLDKKLFGEGIQEISKLCGKIAALCSVGITPSMALSYIAEKESSDKIGEYNLQISKMNADATIESSKYGMASVQKMMM